MIDIEYDFNTGIFTIYYEGEEPINFNFWAKDLNTNLVIYGWFTDFWGKGLSKWQSPVEYLNQPYISGIEINSFVNGEVIFSKKFQHKKTDNRYKFICPSDEMNFGSWESLVYKNEYDLPLNNKDIVYDLGANFGVYTMHALSQKVEKIYAFEPTPKNIECLNQTFKWDENVSIVGKAISNKTETKIFYLHTHSVGNSLNNVTGNPIEVECINLEQWIKDNNALLPTIIKCDIEGAEYDFIESLSDEFFDTIRAFIVEYHYNDSNDKVWPLIKRFLNLGYTIRLVDKNVLEGNMGTFIAEKNWQL